MDDSTPILALTIQLMDKGQVATFSTHGIPNFEVVQEMLHSSQGPMTSMD